MGFFLGNGKMLNTPGNNTELPRFQANITIAEFEQQAALDHQKELVFGLVLMPDELAFEFDYLDV